MTAAVIFWHMESHFVKNGAGLLRNNYRKDKKMYLIAGLGNPTREYEKTRHNVGFSVIDVLADKYNIDVSDRKHKALCGRGVIEGEKVLLLKASDLHEFKRRVYSGGHELLQNRYL